MNPDKIIVIRQQKRINELKELEDENLELKCKAYDLELNNQSLEAELTYWKETAEYWKRLYKEDESESYHQLMCSLDLYLNKYLNKTVDK